MTISTSSRAVRFGRRLAARWAEIDDAQRRMFEIRIGVRPPTRREQGVRREPAARREQPARQSSSAGPEARRARGRYDDAAAAGPMC
jgi:hypothetical protein